MQQNIILAGVGGQGILTIAQAISLAAVRRGWYVKQAEVHGMAQRGGAVQSHLRISDQPIYSDLIPTGRADMVLSVEPLESLRYVDYLCEKGSIVASTNPFVNITNYPPIEDTLNRIAQYPSHILVNAEKLAKQAGSPRTANIVMLGAATPLLEIDSAELETAIEEMFKAKGDKLVQMNLQAFRLGQQLAKTYLDMASRGGHPEKMRQWLDDIAIDQIGDLPSADDSVILSDTQRLDETLSATEISTIEASLNQIAAEKRTQMHEHEVYALIQLVGAINPPLHLFVRPDETLSSQAISRFHSDKLVLKLVSPDVVHKSDAGAVQFVPNDLDTVNRQIKKMMDLHSSFDRRVSGVLVVEFVEGKQSGIGSELFVGIRASREFGPVIAAGMGGLTTEYLTAKMKPGLAVAKAAALDTSAEEFFELFKKTAAYEILSGKVRGYHRVVSDGSLLRCFRAFIAIAKSFCIARPEETPSIVELEVNPFAFNRQKMIPLDGRGRLGNITAPAELRPTQPIQSLLEPRSIAVLGVSAKRANFGRIILNNIQACNFPAQHLYVIKDQSKPIDGATCIPSIKDLPEEIDLLVAATSADNVPELVDQVLESKRVHSVILIPGGMGEKQGHEDVEKRLRATIAQKRIASDCGPVFLGGNSMGVVSRPGKYDTFFIPPDKLDPRRQAKPKPCALISQSGAFIITRMSNIECLDPLFCISAGNQMDLSITDMLQAIGPRNDVHCIGVYVEGFTDYDGLAFIRSVKELRAMGKDVILYKAGRTASGRSATMGHTASVAGDYDVCQAAATQAGAIVADTFKEFEQLIELATNLHEKEFNGTRIAALSNAGYEAVGMADTTVGARYEVQMPPLTPQTEEQLRESITKYKLDSLVNIRNPLDLTPMAGEGAYADCIRILTHAAEIDALVVSVVPLTPQLLTTNDEVDAQEALTHRLPRIFADSPKPIVFVVDSGRPFDKLAGMVRQAGVPVFRSSDQAIRSLGRYLLYRHHRTLMKQSNQRGSRSRQGSLAMA